MVYTLNFVAFFIDLFYYKQESLTIHCTVLIVTLSYVFDLSCESDSFRIVKQLDPECELECLNFEFDICDECAISICAQTYFRKKAKLPLL